METLDYKERIARKNHKCDFCGGVIQSNEKYLWSKHIFDGELYEWKCHKHCSWLSSNLDMCDYYGDGITSDDFCEVVREDFNDKFTTAEMAKLLYDKLKENN